MHLLNKPNKKTKTLFLHSIAALLIVLLAACGGGGGDSAGGRTGSLVADSIRNAVAVTSSVTIVNNANNH